MLDCKIIYFFLLIIENITGMPHLNIMWFIFYDLYCNVCYRVQWLVNALNAVFGVHEHAGMRRHASIDFNYDTSSRVQTRPKPSDF